MALARARALGYSSGSGFFFLKVVAVPSLAAQLFFLLF
jgi:hypothetical protein